MAIADRLGRRLRAAHRVCRTVVLRLRFGDFSRATRSHTLPEATAQTQMILVTARDLLAASAPLVEIKGITLIGLSLTNLRDDRPLQLPLPLDARRSIALDVAVDSVRDRYGADAITRAVLLGRDEVPEVPLLRD